VLLYLLAAVWVGSKRDFLPTHPAKRVGFRFYRNPFSLEAPRPAKALNSSNLIDF
jgi:hypothetical protein